MAKCEISNMRQGVGRVLCWADVKLFEAVTLIGVNLYQDKEGRMCLGLPQRNYTDKSGLTKYVNVVVMDDAARGGVKKRLHDAFLASDFAKPETELVNDPDGW